MKISALFRVVSRRHPDVGPARVNLVQIDDPDDTGYQDLGIGRLIVNVRNPAIAEYLSPGREFRLTLEPMDLVLVATTDPE
jgi:hypothetical protein